MSRAAYYLSGLVGAYCLALWTGDANAGWFAANFVVAAACLVDYAKESR